MKLKRAKSYKKQMAIYVHIFKFKEPFQVLVDGALVLHCHNIKYDLIKMLGRTVQGEVKPMITQCCMEEIYKSNDQEAIDLGKRFERRKCNHKTAIASDDCIELVTNIAGRNKHRYVVATQLENLRKKLREIPAVPMIYMNPGVMVMEMISKATKAEQERLEGQKLTLGLNRAGEEDKEEPKHKRRKVKGPNPLSVKKKQEKAGEKEEGEKKVRRKRGKGKKQEGDNEEMDEKNGKDGKHGKDGKNGKDGENENNISEQDNVSSGKTPTNEESTQL